MKEVSKLVLQLREILQTYFAHHRNITTHGLAQRMGIASTTLSRIINLETKTDPRPTTVMSIVSIVAKETNIHKLAQIYQGPVGDCLLSAFKTIMPASHFSPELSDVLSDRVSYIVYKMAANRMGVARQELVDIMGIPAALAIDDMVDKKLIFEEQGRFHAFKKNFSLPSTIYKKHIAELVRFTDFGSHFVDRSIFRNISESINLETYNQISSLLENAINEIIIVLQQDKSNGEIPFFMTAILDTMEVVLQDTE